MLPHGAVLFKHWLGQQDQEMLLKEVHCLVSIYSYMLKK